MTGITIKTTSRLLRGGRFHTLATVLAAVAYLLLCASASAAIPFCTFGSGPGQCDRPAGVAVDTALNRVYVADEGNDRVNAFSEDGDFLFGFGSTGIGSGQLTSPKAIAVDSDPSSPNFHDVYVVDDFGSGRVQRFSSTGSFELSFGTGTLSSGSDWVAVGPGGTVYVSDNAGAQRSVKKFSPAGVLAGSSSVPGGALVGSLAIDSGGNAYLTRFGNGEPAVQKYELSEPNATLLSVLDEIETRAVAVGPGDDLFAAQRTSGPRFIAKRDAAGSLLKRFGFGQIQLNLNGIAVGASGAVFGSETYVGSETEGNRVIRIAQPQPGPFACCLTATPGNARATVRGEINPEGKSTTFHVDYVTEDDYLNNGFSGAISTPESAPVGSDFELYPAEVLVGCAKVEEPVQPTCLTPSTDYRYRLVATNADGESEAEGTFTSKTPFELEETFATDVAIDSAIVHATVNPLGIPTTGYFEYVDDAAYQADLGKGGDGFAQASKVPDTDAGKAPIDFGGAEAAKPAARILTSLAPATTYHYRFVVTDAFLIEAGPERAFTTYPPFSAPANACPNQEFRTAASAPLPDCRAYEMVSPVDKNGNDIGVLLSLSNYSARLDQSSDDGNRFAYSSSTAFGDAQSAPWSSEYLAEREESKGWFTHSLNPPRDSVPLTDQYVMKFDVQYKLFDPELSNGWLLHTAEPPLDECAPAGFMNLYRRNLASGEYEALLPAEPTNPAAAENGYKLELHGTSRDGTHAVFSANTKLIPEAAKGGQFQLYEHIGDESCGELRLVSYLPNGKPSATAAFAGSPGQPGEHRIGADDRAISTDAYRVFFSIIPAGSPGLERGSLYLRINADQKQSPVNSGTCTDLTLGCTLQITSQDARFWTATTDGSKAIYSIGNQLYEFDAERALAGESAKTLITEGLPTPSYAVAAASSDLSRLYFITTEALQGEGEPGKSNLYLREGTSTKLVATLDPLGGNPTSLGFRVGFQWPIYNGVRATADGRYLAFVTTAKLTGYDNTDAINGSPDLEVHRYDAETGKIVCVSCAPSGARPRGRGGASAMMALGENQTFFPRSLSADGNRLFFESFEALLPRDTNGKADVYEWQRAGGEEECEEVGAELYVPSSEGCLSLISSGQSPQDSEFADASPDGHDVFIRTASSLLPQDDGLVDIYDVRVNGGLPQPPAPPAVCEGEACQGPLAAPNDPTPASSAFEGAGNVQEPATKKKAKKAKKHTKKHHKKKRQARHNRRAGR